MYIATYSGDRWQENAEMSVNSIVSSPSATLWTILTCSWSSLPLLASKGLTVAGRTYVFVRNAQRTWDSEKAVEFSVEVPLALF